MNEVTAPNKAHLWKKGQSGNPTGRPPGSKNAITLVKLKVEGELRAQMSNRMGGIVEKMLKQAESGDTEIQKLLFKAWVSNTKAGEDDAPKDKIQIVIGKLDQVPTINGKTYPQSKSSSEE